MSKNKLTPETIDIETLKVVLKLTKPAESDKEFSKIFDLSLPSYRNSTAKDRYETALCKFYELLNSKKLIK